MRIHRHTAALLFLLAACDEGSEPVEHDAKRDRDATTDGSRFADPTQPPLDAGASVSLGLEASVIASADAGDASKIVSTELDATSSPAAPDASFEVASSDGSTPGEAQADAGAAQGPCGTCKPTQVCLARDGMFRCVDKLRSCDDLDPCSCVSDPRICSSCTREAGYVSCICPAC